jgi:hypothetical protein
MSYGVSLLGVSLPEVTLLLGVSAPVVVLDVALPESTSVDVDTSTFWGAGGWHPMAAANMMTERHEKNIRQNFTAKVLLTRVGNGIGSIGMGIRLGKTAAETLTTQYSGITRRKI